MTEYTYTMNGVKVSITQPALGLIRKKGGIDNFRKTIEPLLSLPDVTELQVTRKMLWIAGKGELGIHIDVLFKASLKEKPLHFSVIDN